MLLCNHRYGTSVLYLNALKQSSLFFENLKKICAQRGTTPSAVAKEIGLSSAAPTYWKRGAIPKSDTVQKIADYFGISVDDLLTEETRPRITHEKGVKIGVLSYIAAGVPMEKIDIFDADDPASWEEITEDLAKGGEFFALRIKWDSMQPRIRRGDIVIVRKQPTVEEGETAVVLVNGNEGTCKRIHYRDDGIQLLSNNPEYEPKLYTWEEIKNLPVQIVGKVEEIRGKP